MAIPAHAREQLAQERRELPSEAVEQDYEFDGADGKKTLSALFDGRSQLIVYHFMFGPGWEAGCAHCSFWADNFNGIIEHLHHRDVTMVAVSRAAYPKLAAYKKRMGWTFDWYSSGGNTARRWLDSVPGHHFRLSYFPKFSGITRGPS